MTTASSSDYFLKLLLLLCKHAQHADQTEVYMEEILECFRLTYTIVCRLFFIWFWY